jgi:hypothetical protein
MRNAGYAGIQKPATEELSRSIIYKKYAKAKAPV